MIAESIRLSRRRFLLMALASLTAACSDTDHSASVGKAGKAGAEPDWLAHVWGVPILTRIPSTTVAIRWLRIFSRHSPDTMRLPPLRGTRRGQSLRYSYWFAKNTFVVKLKR